jgi:hypothetical protein
MTLKDLSLSENDWKDVADAVGKIVDLLYDRYPDRLDKAVLTASLVVRTLDEGAKLIERIEASGDVMYA